jgi:uncharacterized protein YecE (DUF72 family)
MKVFYPDNTTKKLQYYSQFFNTAEIDATFYEKFYKYMTKGTFIAMTKATPDDFQFSLKVPETVTHDKRLDVRKGAESYYPSIKIVSIDRRMKSSIYFIAVTTLLHSHLQYISVL